MLDGLVVPGRQILERKSTEGKARTMRTKTWERRRQDVNVNVKVNVNVFFASFFPSYLLLPC